MMLSGVTLFSKLMSSYVHAVLIVGHFRAALRLRESQKSIPLFLHLMTFPNILQLRVLHSQKITTDKFRFNDLIRCL